jgi:hypothetical protein
LRQTPIRDVEAREQFYARYHRGVHLATEQIAGAHDAVDAQARAPGTIVRRLDVQIAGMCRDRSSQAQVDGACDGRSNVGGRQSVPRYNRGRSDHRHLKDTLSEKKQWLFSFAGRANGRNHTLGPFCKNCNIPEHEL